jgi:hypothetical protein
MGSFFSTLFVDKPFPANAGAVQVNRLMARTTPAHGPSKMPHVMKSPSFPPRDAMGRTVVEDGTGRLRAGCAPGHVCLLRTPVSADFLFSMLQWNTQQLNKYMKERKMLAFCVVGSHDVLMLRDIAYEKACVQVAHAVDQDGTADMVASLTAGPNRLSEAQFREVYMRLCASYKQYGVGALIMKEHGWAYDVMVPNEQEYEDNKALYDAREAALRITNDIRHAGSKRTRSGKKFDRRNN